jgi:NAD(P)-dependent dehydrogenase (short-subunit alcohol dehydrogenase family)
VTSAVAASARSDSGQPEFDLSNRVIWVTGASRGIGAGIALRLARAGANLLLQARGAAGLAEIAEKAAANGVSVETVAGSIADPQVAEEAVSRATARFGRLDGLVANAGISPTMKRSETVTLEEWREVCDTNLTGTFLTSLAAGRQMLKQGSGSIVNLSSVHGAVAGPRLLAYSASKGGVNMLTRTLAVEWADRGVRVNAVAPGYVTTDMTHDLLSHDTWSRRLIEQIPAGRFAGVEDIAGAVQFLLSDAGRYITGVVVEVDGGWTAH